MELKTRQGYDFYEVTSAMQKAIRRNQPAIAGYFALELFHSNYIEYLWKRLLVISAEDCADYITKEIEALHQSCNLLRKNKKLKKTTGRIFVSKAVLILCNAKKCRDADHLQNFIYDKKMISEKEVNEFLNSITNSERLSIPEYAYDCHTKRGRINGKTKKQFFQGEMEALAPRQIGLFDNLVYKL